MTCGRSIKKLNLLTINAAVDDEMAKKKEKNKCFGVLSSLCWVLLPSKKVNIDLMAWVQDKKNTRCFCKHVIQTLTKEPHKEFRTILAAA